MTQKGSQASEHLALSTSLSLLLSDSFLSRSRSLSLPTACLTWAPALTPPMTNSPHSSSVSFATAHAQARSRNQTEIRKVPIQDMTLPAKYTGDVDYLENRANDDCNCMTMLLTVDPSQRLVICLDKSEGISRFISGISNHTL